MVIPDLKLKKRILVAPLNWGLGHAARCIPIINELIAHNFEPIIASDGSALLLLKKEFPQLITIKLPSYQITYAKKNIFFKTKLLLNGFKIIRAINQERKLIQRIIESHHIDGIISDNRMGVYHHSTPSVYITHQLNVLSGFTTAFSSKLHQYFIKKFDECWVPDIKGKLNLSGKLGHLKSSKLKLKYLGVLSRFEKVETPIIYDLLVILSGPEPQRSILEEKLLFEIEPFKGKVLFVKGKIETKSTTIIKNHITITNFMKSEALQLAINQSELVLCRSGYTSIMDLTKLEKSVFFIPTSGQFEQIYLAKRFEKLKLAPSCKQSDFNLKQLDRVSNYNKLKCLNTKANYKNLFTLFNGE